MNRAVHVELVGGRYDGRKVRLTFHGDVLPMAIDVGNPGVARADIHSPPLAGCSRYHLKGEKLEGKRHVARYVLEGLAL